MTIQKIVVVVVEGRKWNVSNDFSSSLKLKTIKNYSCNLSFSLSFSNIAHKTSEKTSTPEKAMRKFFVCRMKQLSDFDWFCDKTRKFVELDVFSWQQLANQIVFHLIEGNGEEKSHDERSESNFPSKYRVKIRRHKQCSSFTK